MRYPSEAKTTKKHETDLVPQPEVITLLFTTKAKLQIGYAFLSHSLFRHHIANRRLVMLHSHHSLRLSQFWTRPDTDTIQGIVVDYS